MVILPCYIRPRYRDKRQEHQRSSLTSGIELYSSELCFICYEEEQAIMSNHITVTKASIDIFKQVLLVAGLIRPQSVVLM